MGGAIGGAPPGFPKFCEKVEKGKKNFQKGIYDLFIFSEVSEVDTLFDLEGGIQLYLYSLRSLRLTLCLSWKEGSSYIYII